MHRNGGARTTNTLGRIAGPRHRTPRRALLHPRRTGPRIAPAPPSSSATARSLAARALEQLRNQGHPVLDTDVAHLSAYLRGHVNVHDHYSFVAPTRQGLLMLCDPDAADELA